MRKLAEVVGIVASMLVAVGCSGSSSSSLNPDAPPSDGPGHTPGMPGLGAHGMRYYHLDESTASSISAAMNTMPSGSTIIASVGRGDKSLLSLPTDNRGNAPYQQLGETHPYTQFPFSGTALYAFTSANGGPGFEITTNAGKAVEGNIAGRYDEITLAAVEVIEGTKVQDYAWNELQEPPLTSKSVTTTGPATLIAFWWGDGFPGTPQSATPNNGFQVIESNAHERDSFVQCVVAVKNVSAAGTYDVTWTAVPVQGAQLWLIAVQ